MKDSQILEKMSSAIRVLSAAAVTKAKSGHAGMPLGMADVATVLYSKFLKFNPKHPNWYDRDRFLLSAGHGSMLLYSILYLCGYPGISIEDLKNFRQLNSISAGHPEYGNIAGIENTSGPLGQGVSNAVGMAIAERFMNNRYGDEIVNHHTYVLAGDGCLMEGVSHEACSLAGHLKLKNLIVLFDDNLVSIDGPTSLTVSDDTALRFKSYGWETLEINAHSYYEIYRAINIARNSDKPSLILCRSVIGKYIKGREGTSSTHSGPLSPKELSALALQLSWNSDDYFDVPNDVLNLWRSIFKESTYDSWKDRLKRNNLNEQNLMKFVFDPNVLHDLKIESYNKTEATRSASGKALSLISDSISNLIGGSSDLTTSNKTKTSSMKPITHDDFSGNYIYYGVREHCMAGCMNGIALHGGVLTYGGTFFVFTDYCRPAIRLSALMSLGVVYVMTHDSIGVGEDGPTHQPIEHLSSLRAMPNIAVFRPADSVECVESWSVALSFANRPSVIVLSRQNLKPVRELKDDDLTENKVALGAYLIRNCSKEVADFTIFATGSEVSIAIDVRSNLESKGYGVNVVSIPCWECFWKQEDDYKNIILGLGGVKVAIEAASGFGWEKFIGIDGIFIGMDEKFGLSAPYQELYKKFGITCEYICSRLVNHININ